MLVYLSAPSVSVCVSVFPIHFCSALSMVQAVKHEKLTQCWPNIYDADPTLAQNWVIVSCLGPR